MRHGGQSRTNWWRQVSRRKKRREPRKEKKSGFHCSFRRSTSRRPGMNKHHMTNRCQNGGKGNQRNVLIIRIDRHRKLHQYFGNLKWEAIGEVIFFGEMRKRKSFRGLSDLEVGDVLFSIFHKRDPLDCFRVIDRVSRAKGRVLKGILKKAA